MVGLVTDPQAAVVSTAALEKILQVSRATEATGEAFLAAVSLVAGEVKASRDAVQELLGSLGVTYEFDESDPEVIRFRLRLPDGNWGTWSPNLKGEQGDIGPSASFILNSLIHNENANPSFSVSPDPTTPGRFLVDVVLRDGKDSGADAETIAAKDAVLAALPTAQLAVLDAQAAVAAAQAAATAAAGFVPANYPTRGEVNNAKAGSAAALARSLALIATFSMVFTSTETVQSGWYTHAAPVGTYMDERGITRDAAVDVPRIDFSMAGECRGILLEAARTNELRNNTNTGAVAASPGTLPTGWAVTGGSGLTRTLGIVTIDGINYLSLRFQGTTADGGLTISMGATNHAAALSGQIWTLSAFVAVLSGLGNLSAMTLNQLEYTSGGSTVTSGNTSILAGMSNKPRRSSYTRTLAGGGTVAFVRPALVCNYANGAAVDFTVLIGLPQLEMASAMSSPIKTTNAAVTRAADAFQITGTDFTSWYRQEEGIHVVEFMFEEIIPSANQYIYRVSDGTVNNYVMIYKDGTNNQVRCLVTVGGVVQCNLSLGVASALTKYKVAFSVTENAFNASMNGGAVQSDGAGSMPTALTVLNPGALNGSGGLPLHGWLFSTDFVPKAVAVGTDVQKVSALT